MHTSKHSPSHHVEPLKITVGCRLCAYPSILLSSDEDTLKITVGCLPSTYPSIHLLTTLKLSRSRSIVQISMHSRGNSQDHGRLPVVHIFKHLNENLHTRWTPWSTRETRGHSRACLNLHHSDIQGTAQKSPCVNTLFEAIAKKRRIWAKRTTQRAIHHTKINEICNSLKKTR